MSGRTAAIANVLLVSTLVVPALAALVLPLCRLVVARVVALLACLWTLAASGALLVGHHPARSAVDPWHEVDWAWVAALRLRFHIGVDGISWPLVLLTSLLVACCVFYLIFGVSGDQAEAESQRRIPLLLSLVFALQTAMLGVFMSLDVVLFFVFFELTLAPMYAVIAGWGGPHRRPAAMKFLLYTGLGSLLLAIGVLLLVSAAGTADLTQLSAPGGAGLSHYTQLAVFVLLLLAFAIKAPLWPLHTWLPDAHTQAPTVGSVLLAGVLLKLGSYGLIRLTLPVLPEAARSAAWLLGAAAVAAIVIGALVCLAQTELKRMIAYSSVGHMGFVLLGVASAAAGSEIGLQAALLGNLAHGVITSLLFFLVGSVKDRWGSTELTACVGLAARLPLLAALLCFGAVASFGLPSLAGFWGEAFSMLAAWQQVDVWWRLYATIAAVAAAIVVAYFLRALYYLSKASDHPTDVFPENVPQAPSSTTFSLKTPGGRLAEPLTAGELLAVVPLVLVTLVLGVWPGGILSLSAGAVAAIISGAS
ncbi:MAG: NADH-quinone oxidoreductase subunit M [Acidimicrobiales bacterium]|nr:MAG: NADH-quinone oxidoreductase subunit M [Acidimicrobiales bacterium]